MVTYLTDWLELNMPVQYIVPPIIIIIHAVVGSRPYLGSGSTAFESAAVDSDWNKRARELVSVCPVSLRHSLSITFMRLTTP